MKKFTFQKRLRKMVLSHIRGKIKLTRNKPQKIICVSRPLSMKQGVKIIHKNLPFIQASDISYSLPKSENVRDMCLDCFKPPASLSCTYRDCNPIRAFETFDISKKPISKTSRFWIFWYKRGCYWLRAIKGIALWSWRFSCRSLCKT